MNIKNILEVLEREEVDEETFSLIVIQLEGNIKLDFVTECIKGFQQVKGETRMYERYLYIATLPLAVKQQCLIDAIKRNKK